MGEDKVKFKDNVMILASDFKNIYPYIDEYIYEDYIVPINRFIMFSPEFFKEKTMKGDIESYLINEDSYLNIFDKNVFRKLTYEYGYEDIFNLSPNILNNVEINEKLIYDCHNRTDEALNSIQIIDNLNNHNGEDITSLFLRSKKELMGLEFTNLIDEVSYHYYSSYMNIIDSSSFHEYMLKEQITRLNCLNGFYLNKFNDKKYLFKLIVLIIINHLIALNRL